MHSQMYARTKQTCKASVCHALSARFLQTISSFFTVPPKGLLNKFQGFEHEAEAFQADEVSLQTNALQTD